MHQILAHSTESPQEAEELSARLKAAGVDVEVRELGASTLVGVLEATRRTWELWVPDASEPAARKVIDEESKALEAERGQLDAELEAEAMQGAPEAEKPPEPKPSPVVTNNARLAGTLIIAGVFLGIAHHVWFTLSAGATPWDGETFIRNGVSLVVAVSLRGGSRGAWKLSLVWVLLQGLYYGIGTLSSPAIVPILEVTGTGALLLLLLGADDALRRKAGLALWAATVLVSFFPLVLAPAALVKDPLVGQWRRALSNHDVIAFCPDGRFISGAGEGEWRRADLQVVAVTMRGENTAERDLYWAFPEHLTFRGARWLPDTGPTLCGEALRP